MKRAVVALVALVLATATPAARQEPSVETMLARVGAYVADYQKRLAGIVAEEHYRQQVTATARSGRATRQFRELKSDLLLVKPGADDRWMQFRDVFEVDRKPIRDRDERLYQLFINAKTDARAQAETIQLESARYNIGPLLRTINIPIMALLFFEPLNQPLIEFKRGNAGNVKRFAPLVAAADVALLEFREVTVDTLVKGANDVNIPSHGRAWIDSTTGRVLRTEHISEDTSVRAVIDVSYGAQSGLELLVPAEMREYYVLHRTNTRIDGRATYRRFRQFTVTTTEKPKQP